MSTTHGYGGKITLSDGTEIPIARWSVDEPSQHAAEGWANFQIRPMRERDADAVVWIDECAFRRSEVWDMGGLNGWTGRVYVAVLDGKVVGFSVWYRRKGLLYLWRIAVHPDYQRSMIGTTLIWDKLRRARMRGDGWSVCYVPEGNLEAQLFLKKCGWIASGTEGDEVRFGFSLEWPLPGE